MQDPPTESGRSGLGIGLARFRSAPATWLDALLEEDDSAKLSDPAPHHHQQQQQQQQQGSLTQLLTSGGDGPGGSPTANPNPNTAQLGRVGSYIQPTTPDPGFYGGVQMNSAAFQRMNSSPAEFLNANIDGYFSTIGIPSSSAYDFVSGGGGGSSGEGSPSGKRLREHDFEQYSPTFSGQSRRELKTANSLVEMEMEKLLEDSVPCRVRAKRGCATHPRSIAERVRRTRISDRIRKLQELVPNMDKQTNTADMLEEAVEYVKTLQRQIEELTEQQKKCQCMSES